MSPERALSLALHLAAGIVLAVVGLEVMPEALQAARAIGFFALRAAPEVLTLSVLALTGGALTSVVVEEMVTEAHEGETSHLGPVALTAGFALFALISV